MAKSQQKPKSTSGTRNSDRRSGKAFKSRTNWSAMEKINGTWGPRVACVPKEPTGKTIMGYSLKRFAAMAKAAGVTVEVLKVEMIAERDRKKQVTRANRREFGQLIRGADKMYRDGTLKHGPTPVLNKPKDDAL